MKEHYLGGACGDAVITDIPGTYLKQIAIGNAPDGFRYLAPKSDDRIKEGDRISFDISIIRDE